jgi:hypothetical protein
LPRANKLCRDRLELQPERSGDGSCDETLVAHSRQLDKPDAPGEIAHEGSRDCDRKCNFSNAAAASKGDDAIGDKKVVNEFRSVSATDEVRDRRREVRGRTIDSARPADAGARFASFHFEPASHPTSDSHGRKRVSAVLCPPGAFRIAAT